MRGLALATISALVLALSGGCGPKETTVTDGKGTSVTTSEDGSARMTVSTPEGKMEFSGDGNQVVVESKDGTFSSGANKVTETDMGVPPYPGATKKENEDFKADTPSETNTLTKFTTSDSPTQILEFYKPKLQEASHSTVSTEGNETVILTGKVDDKTSVVVTIERPKDATETSLTIGTTRKK